MIRRLWHGNLFRNLQRMRPASSAARVVCQPAIETLEERTLFAFAGLAAPVSYGTGSGPQAIATGDFNGDGKLDLVVANSQDNSVSVFLGYGDGTFRSRLTFPVGQTPDAVAVGDFNGDGKLDIVTANFSANTVSVLAGNGDGTFRAHQDFSVASGPTGIVAGDFNNDGKLDIATVDSNSVSILLGNGNGTFATHTDYSVGAGASALAVGDFNGDGFLDLATANQTAGTVSVLLGNGNGTFRALADTAMNQKPGSVAVGDFRGTGTQDIVVANPTANSVSILLGNGDGSFQAPADYSTGQKPTGVAVGDFNGDGHLDVVTANFTDGTVSVLLGNGDGTLQAAQSYPAGGLNTTALAVGDFNGDGVPDVASSWGTASSGTTSVLMNRTGIASQFLIAAPVNANAGVSFPVTVTAKDAGNNTATRFQDTVHFTSSDTQAGLPSDYTFTAADAGVHTFSVTLKTAGSPTFTVTDARNTAVTGTTGVAVAPGAAVALVLSGFVSPTVAGALQSLTVTAKDAFGNVATGYLGQVVFSSSDNQPVLPSNYTFSVSDAGIRVFNAVALKTVGIQSIAATDTTNFLFGTLSGISVTPAAASTFVVSGLPSTATAGTALGFTGTAQDPYGNIATGYTGTVHFTSTDVQAALPGDYTFSGGDNGVHAFVAILKSTPFRTIIATDTVATGVSGSQSTVITPAAAVTLVVSNFTSPTVAGTSRAFTVTAKDAYGNTASGYTGTVTFSSSDSQATAPGNYTFVSTDFGVRNFSATLKTAGTQSLAATDTVNGSITGTQAGISITPAAARSLVVSGYASPATAGTSQSFTVTAKDAYGNIATGYLGTVRFASSDGQAVMPANYPFVAGDNGVHTFTATLKTAATESVTATDTSNGSIAGTQTGISVTPAAAGSFVVSGFASPTNAGTTQSFTVTAKDAYGNIAAGYTGTVHFTSTDPQAAVPGDYTFSSGDRGVHPFVATLKTAAGQSITATDANTATITGTQSGIAILPLAATQLRLTVFVPPTVAGTVQNITITARDPYGNTAPSYTGTVRFASSDAQASLPTFYTFISTDAGVHTFNVTLKTVGSQSITVADRVNLYLTDTQFGLAVNPAPASVLVVTGFGSPVTAGVGQNVTVTAKDPYGNVAIGYTGVVKFTSSDAQAALPANYSFQPGDNGVHTFGVTLKTAASQSITATDTNNASITGSQTGISITPAAASTLTIAGFGSPATAGISQVLTVTAYDPYSNIATGYTGTVRFTSTDLQAALPGVYTFQAGDNGVHGFSATLKTAASQSITATDTGNAGITGSQTGINVAPAAASIFIVAGVASPVTAGVGQNLTVTAKDIYGNVASGYTGTVRFSSSDAQATLPSNYTFQATDNGDHTFSAALKTAASQSITATDMTTASITGTQVGIVVMPAATNTLIVSGLQGTAASGSSRNVTVTAQDTFGNIATGYTGTIHFTSSDSRAGLPPDYTFGASDAGTHLFSVTLRTLGNQTVTVTDTASATLQGISPVVLLVLGPAATFRVGAPSASIVGTYFSVTLTAFDASGNIAAGYAGTVHWSSSDATALLPADYTFTPGDAGSHTFQTATAFRRLGNFTLSAVDTRNTGVGGSAAMTSSNPLEELFVTGGDGQVYGQKLDAQGNAIGSQFLAAPGMVQSLSVGHDGTGRPEVFVIGLDHQVYALKFDANGNPVGSYFLVQPGQVQALAVNRDAIGRPELFVIGLDSQVYAQKFDVNGNPVGPYSLTAAGQVRTLAVGRDALGQPEAFVIGLDGQVYALKFDASGNASGGYFLTQPGFVKTLSVGEDAASNPEVFVIGLDNQVYAQKFNTTGDSASGYFLTQAGQVSSLSVGQDGNFNPEVFVIGMDNQVYAQQFDANDNSASGYFLAQAGQVLALDMGQDAANDPELFVMGLDHQTYAQHFNRQGNPVGGYFLMQPGMVQSFAVSP